MFVVNDAKSLIHTKASSDIDNKIQLNTHEKMAIYVFEIFIPVIPLKIIKHKNPGIKYCNITGIFSIIKLIS